MRPWQGAAAFLLAAVACGPEPAPRAPGPPTPPEGEPATRGPLFRDVTDAAGIDFRHRHGGRGDKLLPEIMGSGVCVLDFDGDGRMDLYFVQSGHIPGTRHEAPAPGNRLYRNLGVTPSGARFEDVTEGSGAGDTGYGMGCVAADYDADGDADLYVTNLGPNVLLRNEGDGTFSDVTERAGVGDPAWSSSAAFFDAEPDGDLDLYVADYLEWSPADVVKCGDRRRGIPAYCHPDVYPMAADVYYSNRGDGTFEEATERAGFHDTVGKGLGVVAVDLTGDGLVDLYVANDSTPNFLYRNLGGGRFQESALYAGVGYNEAGETEAGMGVDAGDVDGDGRTDLVVTNLSREANALYLADDAGFHYASRTSGIHDASYLWTGFGVSLLDLELDGDLDLFVTNGHVIDNIERFDDVLRFEQPSQLFLNDGSGSFQEIPSELTGPLAARRAGRGAATLDYDDDGDLDLVVSFNDDRARLFENVGPREGSWVGLDLRGRSAVGALVEIRANGRVHRRQTRAGSSYQSCQDPRVHTGLGRTDGPIEATIHWLGGPTTQHPLSPDQYTSIAP